MFFRVNKATIVGLILVLSFSFAASAQQTKPNEGTPGQRLDVMRSKLETMRRSLQSAISVIKDENKDDKNKKDDKEKLDTPLGRLRSLEKETSNLQSDINSLRGKVDRSEKYEMSEIDQIEERVRELQTGTDAALQETAALRAKSELEVPFVGACTYFSFFDPAVIARYETTAINGHACELETSVAMHMMPEIVRPDALAPAELTEFATSLRADMRKYDVTVPFAFDEYTLNGALGDARLASAEFGRDLIDSGLDNFCGFVERLLASSYLAAASAAIPEGSRR